VFRHEALLYSGPEQFSDACLTFIRAGVEAGEPVLVMVPGAKLDALRAGLDGQADRVHFADMEAVGANPARIIPAWRRFVDDQSLTGRPMRGIGEPIWAGRSPDELVECQHHEWLLNLAFAGAPAFHLLCPYDVEALDPALVQEAHRTHPYVVRGGERAASADYRSPDGLAAPPGEPLAEPPVRPDTMRFRAATLDRMRRLVHDRAVEAGLVRTRVFDLVLAVNEAATNSVRHGGGAGRLRIWREARTLVCEVRDTGLIAEPLVGRHRPEDGTVGGHGLWLVNQLCDLVQVRSSPTGSVVRVHMRRA